MMAYSEDHIALAAEYALGTLDADERTQVETMMAVDKDFTVLVQAWEFRLGVLNQMVGSVEPRPMVWDNIKAAISHSEQQAPLVLPDAPAQPIAVPVMVEPPPGVDNPNVIQLSNRFRRWRSIAMTASAIAAALVALLSIEVYQPDLLPEGMRPKPRTQEVEVKTPSAVAPAAQYVALLPGQSGGARLHSYSRRSDEEFYCAQGRRACHRGGQELRALADLRQAAAAALARRDRHQRFHRASGAGGLRQRRCQRRDLCGDA